jgi:hypothetical protein
MVRREEQRWRNKATIFLDSRSRVHAGSGAASSFEMAVSAAASLGVHVANEGLTGQFITEGDVIRGGPFFEDRLLDSLAVLRPSSAGSLTKSLSELRVLGGGVIIAVMGRLSVTEAQELAACRGEGSQAVALLLDVASWSDEARRRGQANGSATNGSATNGSATNGSATNGSATNGSATNGAGREPVQGGAEPIADRPVADLPAMKVPTVELTAAGENGSAHAVSLTSGNQPSSLAVAAEPTAPRTAETLTAIGVLRNAGWHVTSIDATTPLAAAWLRLPHAAQILALASQADERDGQPA